MKQISVETQLMLFAHEVLKKVSVQTHTDWSKHLEPIIQKWSKIIKSNETNN